MKAPLCKLLVIVLLCTTVYTVVQLGLADTLSLASFKAKSASLQQAYAENPGRFLLMFFGIYVLTTALSLPGATILTLAGGALLGLGRGVLVVSFASTVGATLAFLASRFLLKDLVQRIGGSRLDKFNQGFASEGVLYLFTLRLVPAFPFFLVNLLMGLTSIRVVPFFWVSQIGMLPTIVVYVNAGTQISQIHSVREILSPSLLISFAVIGLLPLTSRRLLRLFRRGKAPSALLAALVIPLELTRWTPVPMHARTFPKFVELNESAPTVEPKLAWRITAETAAGGYARLLPSGNYDKVQWRWKVSTFPKVKESPPYAKDSDDYALRVGILLSDGTSSIPVPSPFQKLLDANQIKLSRILFYLAVPGAPPSENCAVSPYRSQIGYCALSSGSSWSTITVDPRVDSQRAFHLAQEEAQKLRIVGLWIFSDSDQSSSTAQAELAGVAFTGKDIK